MNIGNSWGGARPGAGRVSTAPEGVPRKQRQLRASDSEWGMVRQFAAIVKSDPDRAQRILQTE